MELELIPGKEVEGFIDRLKVCSELPLVADTALTIPLFTAHAMLQNHTTLYETGAFTPCTGSL